MFYNELRLTDFRPCPSHLVHLWVMLSWVLNPLINNSTINNKIQIHKFQIYQLSLNIALKCLPIISFLTSVVPAPIPPRRESRRICEAGYSLTKNSCFSMLNSHAVGIRYCIRCRYGSWLAVLVFLYYTLHNLGLSNFDLILLGLWEWFFDVKEFFFINFYFKNFVRIN